MHSSSYDPYESLLDSIDHSELPSPSEEVLNYDNFPYPFDEFTEPSVNLMDVAPHYVIEPEPLLEPFDTDLHTLLDPRVSWRHTVPSPGRL